MYGSQCCARNYGTRGVVEIVIQHVHRDIVACVWIAFAWLTVNVSMRKRNRNDSESRFTADTPQWDHFKERTPVDFRPTSPSNTRFRTVIKPVYFPCSYGTGHHCYTV